jgi:16S rRNA (cytosine967-C5)-methyltransferase
MKTFNVRAIAARVCFQVVEQQQSLSQVLPSAQQPLNPADKALVGEISYGVLRHLPILDQLISVQLTKKLGRKDRVIHHLLMVGAYQLYFMRTAKYAVLSETVEAARALKAKHLTKLVNAILRKLDRERPSLPDNTPVFKYRHPNWLIQKIQTAYPHHWQTILEQNNQRSPMWLRNNARQQPRSQYLADLKQADINASPGPSENAMLLEQPCGVTQLPRFMEGSASVQDAAAQWAAELLICQPNDRVLDACAAPGGKTCHLLERYPWIQELVAIDIEPQRLQSIDENLKRLQLSANIQVGDASDFSTWHQGAHYDRILLDAPCSATGVIRRHPDIKWLRQASDITCLVKRQAEILDACWQHLKPNGVLLYATCSVLPEENEQQIVNFLARTPNAKHCPIEHAPEKIGWQILPGQDNMDGFYYARLQKLMETDL